eukprot:gene9941-13374_t
MSKILLKTAKKNKDMTEESKSEIRRIKTSTTKDKANKSNIGSNKDKDESKVIYVGHLPNCFHESEMRKFFSQFGEITRLKLFKSTKTNASKGYAFIDFQTSEEAKIVSEAVNGYILQDRVLVSHVIPLSKNHDGMFKTKRKMNKLEDDDKNLKDLYEENVEEISSTKLESYTKKLRIKADKLSKCGIDFQIIIPGNI